MENLAIPRYPRVLAQIICEYAATYQFLPWVEELTKKPVVAKIVRREMMQIWENPNGIDMALRENLPMSWTNLSANSNPWAIARLMENPKKIAWEGRGYGNPGLPYVERPIPSEPEFDWCRSAGYVSRNFVAANPRDEYVDELLTPYAANDSVQFYTDQILYACKNPNPRMVEFVIAKGYVNDTTACANPNGRMLEYLLSRGGDDREWPFTWKYLSANSHPVAIEMLRTSPEQINWSEFLTNPGIFTQRVDTGVFELLVG